MNQKRKGVKKVEQQEFETMPSAAADVPGVRKPARPRPARDASASSRPKASVIASGKAGAGKVKPAVRPDRPVRKSDRSPVRRAERPGSRDTKQAPREIYRVEGIGRKGMIRHVKVVGRPGQWQIIGLNGLFVEVTGATVADALKRAGRRIPFRPIAIRRVEDSTG